MRRTPIAITLSFIDCINRGDADALAALMTDDHELCVFDEAPLAGRAANVSAWRGYASSFPDYVIEPERIRERASAVAVLGHTVGSHLALPDDEERALTLIWVADVVGDRVQRWRLVADDPANRERFGLNG